MGQKILEQARKTEDIMKSFTSNWPTAVTHKPGKEYENLFDVDWPWLLGPTTYNVGP